MLSKLVTKVDMDKKITKLSDKTDTRITQLGETIREDEFKKTISELEQQNEEWPEAIGTLENQVVELQFAKESAKASHNDLEQHGRKHSIRISGLEDSSADETVEECVARVVEFVNAKLNVRLDSNDIDIAHRLERFVRDKREV